MIEETIQLEGPQTIAAFILEPVMEPTDSHSSEGYLEGCASCVTSTAY